MSDIKEQEVPAYIEYKFKEPINETTNLRVVFSYGVNNGEVFQFFISQADFRQLKNFLDSHHFKRDCFVVFDERQYVRLSAFNYTVFKADTITGTIKKMDCRHDGHAVQFSEKRNYEISKCFGCDKELLQLEKEY